MSNSIAFLFLPSLINTNKHNEKTLRCILFQRYCIKPFYRLNNRFVDLLLFDYGSAFR